jgi:hypothetical protein
VAEYSSDTSQVVSVWSAYGHRFIGTDEPTHESCLTCGAMYQLLALADDPTRGEYMAANGDAPMECSGDTSMTHGYPGERHDGNVDHSCNCLLCA